VSIDLRGKKVLVTGGNGFLGRHLCRVLGGCGAMTTSLSSGSKLHDLGCAYNTIYSDIPDYVFHLAGYNGGIEFNRKNPADIFYRNTVMGLNVLEACRQAGVKKVVSVVASCAYGDDPLFRGQFAGSNIEVTQQGILHEKNFLAGQPNDSVACHGYAKRNLQLASRFYRDQYGCNFICACPTTLYGPGDSYDPQRTKVMGGMIKRFVDAANQKLDEVQCWGSGNALREFLYVEDAAKLLIKVMERHENNQDPLNLGSGQEVSIRDLATLVAIHAGYEGRIAWDTSKPDGQLRKRLDTTRQERVIGPFEFTPLTVGVAKTVAAYRKDFYA